MSETEKPKVTGMFMAKANFEELMKYKAGLEGGLEIAIETLLDIYDHGAGATSSIAGLAITRITKKKPGEIRDMIRRQKEAENGEQSPGTGGVGGAG